MPGFLHVVVHTVMHVMVHTVMHVMVHTVMHVVVHTLMHVAVNWSPLALHCCCSLPHPPPTLRPALIFGVGFADSVRLQQHRYSPLHVMSDCHVF